MAEYVVIDKEQLEADLTSVADAIRNLISTEDKMEFPQGYIEAINSLTEQTQIIDILTEGEE